VWTKQAAAAAAAAASDVADVDWKLQIQQLTIIIIISQASQVHHH